MAPTRTDRGEIEADPAADRGPFNKVRKSRQAGSRRAEVDKMTRLPKSVGHSY